MGVPNDGIMEAEHQISVREVTPLVPIRSRRRYVSRQPHLTPPFPRDDQLLFQPQELFRPGVNVGGEALVGRAAIDGFVRVVEVERVEGYEDQRVGNGVECVVASSGKVVLLVLGDEVGPDSGEREVSQSLMGLEVELTWRTEW